MNGSFTFDTAVWIHLHCAAKPTVEQIDAIWEKLDTLKPEDTDQWLNRLSVRFAIRDLRSTADLKNEVDALVERIREVLKDEPLEVAA